MKTKKRRQFRRLIAAVSSFVMIFALIFQCDGMLGGIFAAKTAMAGVATKSGTTNTVDGDHFYDFRDGSIIPTNAPGNVEITYQNMVIKPGATNTYKYNGNQHGEQFSSGCSIDFTVDGSTRISVGDCQYNSVKSMTLTSSDGSYTQTVECGKGCYDQTGDMAVFTYVGDATTLTLAFTGTAYVPCIEVQALHKVYDFTKRVIIPETATGAEDITYGSLAIKAAAGATYCYNGGQHGEQFVAGNKIELAVAGPTKVKVGGCQYSNQATYTLKNTDGSYSEVQNKCTACYPNESMVFTYDKEEATTLTLEITATTYIPIITTDVLLEEKPDNNGAVKDTITDYNFSDGSVVPTTCDSANQLNGSVTSTDNMLTVTSAGQLYTHDGQHGLAVCKGDQFDIKVAGDATITFHQCQYGSDSEGYITAASKKGKITESKQPIMGTQDDGLCTTSFHYTGVATTLTFTVTGTEAKEYYLHGISVNNLPDASATLDYTKDDVWDFGAAQLDATKYNNMLTTSIINGLYPSTVTPGTNGNSIGNFTMNDFVFRCGAKTNNRIRTSNTKITRYDDRTDVVIGNQTLTGYLYSNNASATVYTGIKLYKDDILTLYTGSNGGQSTIVCESPSGKKQTASSNVDGVKITFYATEYGEYKIYSQNEKLVLYRAIRQHTQPVTVSGTVNTDHAAGIDAKDYKLAFTCNETGAVTKVDVTNGAYTATLNEQYTYTASLVDANGYVIETETTLPIARGDGNKTFNISVKAVTLVTLTGEVKGLSSEALAKVKLKFVNKDYIYEPEYTISGTSITVNLEKDVNYDIVVSGINDYYLTPDKISSSESKTYDFDFALKPVYQVNLSLTGLPDAVKAGAKVTFTNINESGYSYTFNSSDTIKLRDGQYDVYVSNIGSETSAQKLTSYLTVNGKAVDKTVEFAKLSTWDFSKYNTKPGIETIDSAKYYMGLQLSDANVLTNKIYLLMNETGTIKIPVVAGQLVTLQYCFCAGFSINNDVQVQSKTESTGTIETTQYTATETGFVTLTGVAGTSADNKATGGQTYFTSIQVSTPVVYKENITVGQDKEYKTINEALDAITRMARPNNERVNIVIDPGNYEEMLRIYLPNVSLVNAAGDQSSLALKDQGVNIEDNVVRITSYYGHGYNYYSMTNNCYHSDEVLKVNQENGAYSFKNTGSGSTDNSYWNATVVVYANGFEANGIVFENSFNQYISNKEAQDTVVCWDTGSKGVRPTVAGDTSVQNKSFVERAAAMAILGDKTVINNCKFVGRQDTLYGATDIKAAFQKCDILGGTDYIFGGMNAVFYQCNLRMNTSDASADVAYTTAAQQSTGRGYLMYNCNITSTTPGVDTASANKSKPGFFGRPWAANTSEVVFYRTNIETTDFPGYEGKSLISPLGWNDSLGGTSSKMYEYASTELSGEDNSASRLPWATLLTTPYIDDGATKITFSSFLGDWAETLQQRGMLKELTANYSKVDAAIDTAEKLSSFDYVSSLDGVYSAVSAVKRNVGIEEQASVDAMAKAITDAIDALVPVEKAQEAVPGTDGKQTQATTVDAAAIVDKTQVNNNLAATISELNLAKVYSKDAPTINKDIFNIIKGKDKTVEINVTNADKKLLYSWTFNGKDINNSADLDLGITFDSTKAEELKKLTESDNLVFLNFAYHGTLPGKATIKVYVGDHYNNGDKVFLYYYNEETGKAEKMGYTQYEVKDGYIECTIDHCSLYFTSTGDLVTEKEPGQTTEAGSTQTGDTMNMTLYIYGLLISMLAGGVVVYRRKRRNA